MIYLSRNGTLVRCTVHLRVPNYELRLFHFEWETNNRAFAGLLSAEMDKQLQTELERIRREAYERGWKDAKAKKPKETYFDMGWA